MSNSTLSEPVAQVICAEATDERDASETIDDSSSVADIITSTVNRIPDPFKPGVDTKLLDISLKWNGCNKAPLDHDEVKRLAEAAIKERRRRILNEDANAYYEINASDGSSAEWRMEVITGNEAVCRVFSPLWSASKSRNYVEIKAKQFLDPTALCIKVFNDCLVRVEPGKFAELWNGAPGLPGIQDEIPSLADRLLLVADFIAPHEKEPRDVMALRAVLQYLLSAAPTDKNQLPDSNGQPVLMRDGTVWFKVGAVESAISSIGRFKQSEIEKALKTAGATREQARVLGVNQSFKVVFKETVLRLLGELAPAQIGTRCTQNSTEPIAL